MITKEDFLKRFPNVRDTHADLYLPLLATAMQEFSISDEKFLAQVLEESKNLTYLQETFKYSAAELRKLFPKKFLDITIAILYEYKQDKIASRIYSGKWGNGNEPRPDGWTYRGRGLIKIIGKETYYNCGKILGLDLVRNPDLLLTPENAARSAAWSWSKQWEVTTSTIFYY